MSVLSMYNVYVSHYLDFLMSLQPPLTDFTLLNYALL